MANVDYNEKLKKYIEMYNILKEVKDDDKNGSILSDNQSSSLYNGLDSTSWSELGKSVLISDGVPYLKGSLENINDSINNNLLEANGILYDKIYPLLEDLNRLKGQYNELNTKTIVDTTDTISIDSFNKVKTKIDEDILNIDNYLQDINNLGKDVKSTATWMAGNGNNSTRSGSGKIDLVSYTGGSKSAEQIASLKNTHSILEAKKQGASSGPSGLKASINEQYTATLGGTNTNSNKSSA